MGIDYDAYTFYGISWASKNAPWPEVMEGYNPDEPEECAAHEEISAALEANGLEFRRFGNSYSGYEKSAVVVSASLASTGPGISREPALENAMEWRVAISDFCDSLGITGLAPYTGRHVALNIW